MNLGPAPELELRAWLARVAHENLGTEQTLMATAGDARRRLHVARAADGTLTGVSISWPGGAWFIEAVAEDAVAALVGKMAAGAADDVWPAKVMASAQVARWLKPELAARGVGLSREHLQLVMVCSQPSEPGEGRFASPTDRAGLQRYQAFYNEERGTSIEPNWDFLLRHRRIGVLDHGGRIGAALKRTSDTVNYATVGGTWTDPDFRRLGLAGRLTAFVVTAGLADRPAVLLIVDDDNTAAIATYRHVGFAETGACYMGYLA